MICGQLSVPLSPVLACRGCSCTCIQVVFRIAADRTSQGFEKDDEFGKNN